MNRLQKFNFIQDPHRPENYILDQKDQGLFFTWFKLSESREESLRNRNAIYGIETFIKNERVFITGLIPVKGYNNLYYGDVNGETIVFWSTPDQKKIKIGLFKGHRPKYRQSRERKVIELIRSMKNQSRDAQG